MARRAIVEHLAYSGLSLKSPISTAWNSSRSRGSPLPGPM
jgi:hypothetical protein